MNVKSLTGKKIKIRRFSVPLLAVLLAVCLATALVLGTAFVILTWNISATVNANPSVHFWSWSGSSAANLFTYSVNIYPSVTTIDKNITYGITNSGTALKSTNMSWTSCSTSGNIASLGIKVYNNTAILYQQYWTSIPSFPTPFVAFSPFPSPGKYYTIYMNITGTSSASGSSTFVFTLQAPAS